MPADLELCEHLEDAGVFTVGATDGTGIFAGEIPAGVVNAAALTLYPGAPPEHQLGVVGMTMERPRLQLRVRNTNEATALTKAQNAAVVLSKVANQVIEGVRYRAVHVLQGVGLLYRDENNLANVGFNMEAERDV